jgi:glycosyltransferase involved in cell wall biosynthesis
MKTISVVTPSKNQGRFIEKTLRSVINQKFSRLQYIVIDGASTDETLSILRRYKKYIDVLVSEPDEDHPHALVKGFGFATGDILAFLNADDQYCPGALASASQFFSEHPDVDLLYSNRICIDEHGSVTGTWMLPHHSNYFMLRSASIPQETAFWRRSAYDSIGGIDTNLFFAFDYDFFIRLMRYGRTAHHRGFHAAFRLHPESKTMRLYDTIGVEDVQRTLRKNNLHPSRVDRILCALIRRYVKAKSRLQSRPTYLRTLERFLQQLDYPPS